MSITLLLILDIISTVSILFIIATGLAIIFGLMGVVNLAHGHFVMLGAYTALLIVQNNLNPWLALIAAPLILAVVGLFVERFLIRMLYGKIMESILATWGLGIVITQIVELIFGKDFKQVPIPIDTTLLNIDYSFYRLLIIAFAIVLLIVLALIERRTNLGITVRAVIANHTLASTLGVNIGRVYQMTFIAGSALAGLAGAIIAPLVTVYSNMGIGYVVNAFLAILVGGAGSLFGLVGGSTLLAGSDSIVSFWADKVWGSFFLILVAMVAMKIKQLRD